MLGYHILYQCMPMKVWLQTWCSCWDWRLEGFCSPMVTLKPRDAPRLGLRGIIIPTNDFDERAEVFIFLVPFIFPFPLSLTVFLFPSSSLSVSTHLLLSLTPSPSLSSSGFSLTHLPRLSEDICCTQSIFIPLLSLHLSVYRAGLSSSVPLTLREL